MSCKTAIELLESLNLKVNEKHMKVRIHLVVLSRVILWGCCGRSTSFAWPYTFSRQDLIKQFDTNGDERLDFGEFIRTTRALRGHNVAATLFKV
jgi:hypothetical protein